MSAIQQVIAAMGASAVTGQAVLTGSGNWTVPAGVTSISIVGVGAGAPSCVVGKVGVIGGGGGELRYKNNYTVTPGASIPYVVGQCADTSASGSVLDTTFNTNVVIAHGGARYTGLGGLGGTGDGGGDGGDSILDSGSAGGGGAGGYAGKGGNGNAGTGTAAAASSGAAGGGSGNSGSHDGGGGVGLLGKGADGGINGGGGSNGNSSTGHTGAQYGGGAGRFAGDFVGAVGGLRIIWPGNTRSFPSTNTADM